MRKQSSKTSNPTVEYDMDNTINREVQHKQNNFSREEIMDAFKKIAEFKNFFQQQQHTNLDNQPLKLMEPANKKSFLVNKHNKYITIPIENIAFFYVKYESSMIKCFEMQEYFVSHSLEQVQHLICDKEFFRLNRQYLVNFKAIKEVEHYYGRKLLVNLTVPVEGKLLVPKEKVTGFLHWLDNR